MSETKSTKKTIELDKERFGNKLDTLLESWKVSEWIESRLLDIFLRASFDWKTKLPTMCFLQTQNENWQGTTAIVIPTGEAPGDIRYWKSSSLFLWMLGYEFTG